MDTAGWYRYFADVEAAGSSATYRTLADGVCGDDILLEHLDRLPGPKRQPNLLFASVQFLDGPTATWSEFRSFVLDRWDDVSAEMTSRSTQTNEAARCSAFLPVLGTIDGPIALVEVGASAGLCLFPDRYGYSYDGENIGASPLRIDVGCSGPVPVPTEMPEIVWRRGVDVNPLDVTDPTDVAWLHACIWPEHEARRERLDRAVEIAALDPPVIVCGDLDDEIDELLDAVPTGATPVVFHSAVLSYLGADERQVFARKMARRHDVVWISNEGPGVVEGIVGPASVRENSFVLAVDGARMLAHTDPHGQRVDWLP